MTGNVTAGVLPLGKYGSEVRSRYARRRRLDDSNDTADDDADDDASHDADDGDDCDDASHDADDDAKEDRPEAIDGEERSPLSPRERGVEKGGRVRRGRRGRRNGIGRSTIPPRGMVAGGATAATGTPRTTTKSTGRTTPRT